MTVDPAVLKVADAVGALIEAWGFRRNMGRMWAVLYLEDHPLTAADLGDRLGLSTGAVSMLVNELIQWGIIKKTWVVGERREHFEAETSIWKMISRVFRERELRWIRTAHEAFAEACRELEAVERSEMGGGDPAGSAGGAGGKAPRGIERSEMGGGDPAGSAGGAGGKAPRGIERSEMGGGDPAGSAGGAGGKAPRGIERSEMGGGDPAGSAGGAGGKAPRGIDDTRHQLIAGRLAGLTQLAEVGAHLLETMLEGEAIDSLPIKTVGELAGAARPATDPDKPT